MKKQLLVLAMVVALVAVAVPATAQDPSTDLNAVTVDLIAGGGNVKGAMDVGDVIIWHEGDFLYVKYIVEDPTPGSNAMDDWYLAKVQAAVALAPEGIPQTKGNPVPGLFPKEQQQTLDNTLDALIAIPWDPVWDGQQIVVAAHADVSQPGGVTQLALALPSQATIKVTFPVTGGSAYFPTLTVTDGGVLNGIYPGWCVDTDRTIDQNTPYTANIYSSYEVIPAGLIEYSENLDLVNWILNQNYVGATSGCLVNGIPTTYTYSDVQRAIWQLVEDTESTSGLGSWSQCRVNEILAAAAGHEGFEPTCGQNVAVIVAPVNGAQVIIAQVILGVIPVPCVSGSNTAWAAKTNYNGDGTIASFDYPFGGKNWAAYVLYPAVVAAPA